MLEGIGLVVLCVMCVICMLKYLNGDCMFFFHKYPKWSERNEESWYSYYPLSGHKSHYLRHYQERYCEKCGKYQKKYLD